MTLRQETTKNALSDYIGRRNGLFYVLSDIHGNRKRFDSIMKQINLQPEDTLYVLGDVIDRNPHGIQILRQLMSMPNVKMIPGNHEHMMLDALFYPHCDAIRKRRISLWYANGGDITHNYLMHIRKALRAEIFEYLDSLPINEDVVVNGKRYILAHAAPTGLFDKYRNSTKHRSAKEFALWHRFTGHEKNLGAATIIFGHTGTFHYQMDSCARIWRGTGLIGIDCGAAYSDEILRWTGCSGRLACLRLDDMKEFYSEEGDAA